MSYSARQRKFRSALADYPTPPPPERPSVGIVVPVYNESAHLMALVADLLAQDYDAIREIWFVDGGSNDGSADQLQDVARRDDRVRVIDNPRRLPAAALNLAIPQMHTDIVLRLDAHAGYAPDVVRQSVETLLATGAGGVGAIARPVAGKTLVARSIVAAHKSRLGTGGAKFREEGAAGWVDTVWNGCYWRHVIDKVGPLREDLRRAEDNDFNERVRRLGYGLYLSPTIQACYRPRQSLRALWSQDRDNGMGVALAWFDNRHAFGLRHLAPLATRFRDNPDTCGRAGLAAGADRLRGPPWALCRRLACRRGTGRPLRRGAASLLLPCTLAIMHLGYGCGGSQGLLIRGLRAAGISGRSVHRLGAMFFLAWAAGANAAAALSPTVGLLQARTGPVGTRGLGQISRASM